MDSPISGRRKTKLGTSTLRIKFNRILGYYIEISKGQAENVPEHYFRKQTLVGSERFTTEELQKFESEILTASDEIVKIEKEEIEKLTKEIVNKSKELQNLADLLGEIDVYCSLARSAILNGFIRPEFNDEDIVHIKEGRHPIVERYYTKEIFIPNDINLDNKENLVKIITGPNMSGKSYLYQNVCHHSINGTGWFIYPCKESNLSIVDRIFTRIGASDNISRGESTFL